MKTALPITCGLVLVAAATFYNARQLALEREQIGALVGRLSPEGERTDEQSVVAQREMLAEQELLAKQSSVQEYERRSRQLQIDVQLAKAAMEAAEAQEPTVHESMVERALNQDPEYKRQQGGFAALAELLREAKRLRSREDDPQVQHLEEEIRRSENAMAHMRGMAHERIVSELHAEQIAQATRAYEELIIELEVTQQVYDQLLEEYNRLAGS